MLYYVLFFFFKQKTAYEMRISDWSSDVCSSDLVFVSEINVGTQLRLLEVRRELERLIARCAARRATDAELLQFREIAEHLETAARANDSKVFMQQDRAFNILSASAARNEFLSGSMDLIHSLSRRFWYAFQQRVADMPHTARLHADVANAIADRNSDAAAIASDIRSEEHTSELQSLMRNSYAVFCLKKKTQ